MLLRPDGGSGGKLPKELTRKGIRNHMPTASKPSTAPKSSPSTPAVDNSQRNIGILGRPTAAPKKPEFDWGSWQEKEAERRKAMEVTPTTKPTEAVPNQAAPDTAPAQLPSGLPNPGNTITGGTNKTRAQLEAEKAEEMKALVDPSQPWRTPEQIKVTLDAYKAKAKRDAATMSISDETLHLLNSQGWGGREVSEVKLPTDMYDVDAATELSPYEYGISDQEKTRLQQLYGGDKAKDFGLTAPKTIKDLPQNIQRMMENPNDMVLTAGTAPVIKGVLIKDNPTFENEAVPLTAEAYNNLSKDEKGAVDANTLLVAAREADIAGEYKLKGKKKKAYEKAVTEMFGEGGGADIFAPNTVALLKQLDYKAIGQDLDEYLSLERAFSAKDLQNLTIDPEAVAQLDENVSGQVDWEEVKHAGPMGEQARTTQAAVKSNYEDVRSNRNMEALDASLVTTSRDLIKDMYADSFNPQLWGIVPATSPAKQWKTEEVPLGYGTDENIIGGRDDKRKHFDDMLQSGYIQLADPSATPGEQWKQVSAAMDEFEWTPEDRKIFIDYVDQRTRNEKQYGRGELYGREGQVIENPYKINKIRVALGLEEI